MTFLKASFRVIIFMAIIVTYDKLCNTGYDEWYFVSIIAILFMWDGYDRFVKKIGG